MCSLAGSVFCNISVTRTVVPTAEQAVRALAGSQTGSGQAALAAVSDLVGSADGVSDRASSLNLGDIIQSKD